MILLRRALIGGAGGVKGLRWINPVTSVARGVNLNQSIPWPSSGSQGIRIDIEIQFDPSVVTTNDYIVLGTTAGGNTNMRITDTNKIVVNASSYTGPAGNLFDGEVHKITMIKSNALSTSIAVDDVFWSAQSLGTTINWNFLGGVATSGGQFSFHGIIKNFVYTDDVSTVVINMPIDEGEGATINNTGTSGTAGTVIGTENTDYIWT